MDSSRFIAAQCSRRAGKTNGLAFRFFRTLSLHPNSLCVYIALTRESARNIMWPILTELNDKFQIGCVLTESNLTMTHPNGARLQLFGADMQNFIRRLKGIKTPGVAIDEAQDFGSHLRTLVDDVISPALTDYEDSWLAITGTPGPVPLGFFFETTAEQKGGYSLHRWTLFDNPYLPQAKTFVSQLKEKRGWNDLYPTLRREWYNEWVLDKESLLIKYNEGLCHYETLPLKDSWIYILGIDVGFRDSDALAILGWSERDPNIYLIEERTMGSSDITSLVEEINRMGKLYDISKTVIDTGGLGKKIAEEIIRRHQIPVQAADKLRKMENVALLNDWLRLGKFKAKKTSRFVEDSYKLQIDWDKTRPDKIIVKDTFHSDIIDAVLYAFRESPAYTYTAPKIKPKYGTPAWAKEQEEEMEQAAIDFFTAHKNFAIVFNLKTDCFGFKMYSAESDCITEVQFERKEFERLIANCLKCLQESKELGEDKHPTP
jgi:hypothetical protein